MTGPDKKARRRDDYPFILDYRTRCTHPFVKKIFTRPGSTELPGLFAFSLAVSVTVKTACEMATVGDWTLAVDSLNDNDMYDHMNNSVYNFLFDSAVNAYLAEYCGIHPPNSPFHPLVAHTSTNFYSSIAYPAVAEVGLRVAKLGNSSVTFELAVFEKGLEGVKAVCDFVHVFVQRSTGRPAEEGMPPELRKGLVNLQRGEIGKTSKL